MMGHITWHPGHTRMVMGISQSPVCIVMSCRPKCQRSSLKDIPFSMNRVVSREENSGRISLLKYEVALAHGIKHFFQPWGDNGKNGQIFEEFNRF